MIKFLIFYFSPWKHFIAEHTLMPSKENKNENSYAKQHLKGIRIKMVYKTKGNIFKRRINLGGGVYKWKKIDFDPRETPILYYSELNSIPIN